jgi:hypothetical protein
MVRGFRALLKQRVPTVLATLGKLKYKVGLRVRRDLRLTYHQLVINVIDHYLSIGITNIGLMTGVSLFAVGRSVTPSSANSRLLLMATYNNVFRA